MPTTHRPLTAAAVAAMRRGLQVALDGPSGPDDAGRLDTIRALEELACTVSAAQTALAAELAESVDNDHEVLGIPADQRGQGVVACEACNYAKEAPRWRARPGPGGGVTTTLPTGHTYFTRPPPVATIRRRTLPALQVDYVLTG